MGAVHVSDKCWKGPLVLISPNANFLLDGLLTFLSTFNSTLVVAESS